MGPMDAAKREFARRLFEEAISTGTPDPAEWTSTKTDDREVVAEVIRLLERHGSHATHSDAASTPGVTKLADPLLGATLGGFVLVKMVGVGGMGRVYLGTPLADPKGEVALKVLARGLTGSIALQRFEREAEVLGRLKHPGIAAFLGSGVYDDGEGAVPWFAMEFVGNAMPLSQWCDFRNLTLRERVGVVAQVGDAIGYAHRLGIVHRDLKSANILVNPHGETKIIDFGVARCVGSESGLGALQTQTGQLVGTMQYMSPEQFEGDPRKIDQRADVYALGVILYELLSGTYPHDVRTLPVAEAARMVCQENAPDIRTCLPDCDGALATIVAQCLARSRESRYLDAGQVEAALSGWLRGVEPIAIEPSAKERVNRGPGREPRGEPEDVHRGIEVVAIARSGGWLVPILSLLLVAVVVLVATGLVTPQRVVAWWHSAQAQIVADATGSVPGGPTFVEPITVESDPAGATVTLDGKVVGMTPCRSEVAWQEGRASATVVVAKDGFRRETMVIAAAPRGGRTAPLKVAVRLVPALVPTHP